MRRVMHWTCALALALSLAACDQGSSGGSVVPGGHGTDSDLQPQGGYEGETFDELRLRLDRLEQQREQAKSLGNHDPDKCEELCELSRSICEVQSKMCEIADERPSDSEYQNLCRVAKQRCQQASDSCVQCVQHHQRMGTSGPAGEPDNCGGD